MSADWTCHFKCSRRGPHNFCLTHTKSGLILHGGHGGNHIRWLQTLPGHCLGALEMLLRNVHHPHVPKEKMLWWPCPFTRSLAGVEQNALPSQLFTKQFWLHMYCTYKVYDPKARRVFEFFNWKPTAKAGLIHHGGNHLCLHAPWSLPWWPWSAQVEIYNFLI